MFLSDPPFNSDLVRAVADALKPRADIPAGTFHDVDLEAFAYVARYWHVASSLWLNLRNCPEVPGPIREQLRAEYWRNVEANAKLRTAASQLFSTLNERGIVPMLLKGGCQLIDPPAGHTGTRFMADLDVLAPFGQDHVSFDALCKLGFVPADDSEAVPSHHWPKLARPEDGLVVEIHKTPWIGGADAETEAFFACSVPVAKAVGECRLPCASHRLLHNAVHAFQWNEVSWFGGAAIYDACSIDTAIGLADLRQLLDFVELCAYRGHELDWNWIMTEADRFGHKADLQQWSALAHKLFAVQLPDDVATWNVDRPGRRFSARCRRLVKAALRKTRLLNPVRRWKSRWFK